MQNNIFSSKKSYDQRESSEKFPSTAGSVSKLTMKSLFILLFIQGVKEGVPSLKPILDTTECQDSMSLALSLVPLIGPARPFSSSWRLTEHLCSMSLTMLDPLLAHCAL